MRKKTMAAPVTTPSRARVRRRLAVSASAWALAASLLPVVALSVVQAPPAAAATNSACVGSSSPGSVVPPMNSYSNAASPLLLPAWGDGGGWSQADQYETIMSGDIDGDGYGDLLGRNASTLETHTVAPPQRPPLAPGDGVDTSTNAPWPGQWIPKANAHAPSFPERGTQTVMNGQSLTVETNDPGNTRYINAPFPVVVPEFTDASHYMTFRLANLDGIPGDELLVRAPHFSGGTYVGTFLTMYRYVNGTWSDPVLGPAVNDSNQYPQYGYDPDIWSQPQYYSTITTGSIDSDPRQAIVMRGPDLAGAPAGVNAGLTTWRLNAAGTGFDQLAAPQDLFNSAAGFADPSEYTTFRMADFTGDGHADLVARSNSGLDLYSWNGAGWSYQTSAPFTSDGTLVNWSNSAGSWTTQPSFYATIGVGRLDNDDRSYVFALEPTGLKAYRFSNSTAPFSWKPLVGAASPNILSGSNYTAAFSDPTQDSVTAPNYATIQAGDVLGTPGDEILARDAAGVHVYSYDTPSQSFQEIGPTLTQFSDANGWNQPDRYKSIHTAFVHTGQPRALIGRDATGLRTYQLASAQATSWTSPSAPFPAWANGNDATNYVPPTVTATYPAARAYNYINTVVGNQLYPNPSYPGQPPKSPATIRSQYTNLVQDMGTIAGATSRVQPKSLNVSRQTWSAVKQQMTDWTLSVQQLRNYFFNASGATSIEQIMLTSLVIGDTAYSAETIRQQFNAKDTTRMWAAIGDMLWGIIGAVATDGASWAFSLMGAGVAAGLVYAPSNKYTQALNLEAADLDAAIANTFCQADAFLYGSHDQAVGDLGLLTAMGMAINANPLTSGTAAAAQGSATRGRATWIYQQFAALSQDEGGWTMAFQPALCVNHASTELAYGLACRGGATNPNIPCPVQRTTGQVCGTQNQVGAYFAFPISKDCQGGLGSSYSTSGLQNPAYSVLVQNLQANPLDMATPSWTFWEKPNSPGKPPGSNNDPGGTLAHIVGDPQLWDYTDGSGTTRKVTGTLGWHLPVTVNSDAKGCSNAIAMAWPPS